MKVTIDRWIYGGAGAGRDAAGDAAAGAVLLVPFTMPKEVIEATVPAGSSPVRNGELVKILDASPERVAARCAHFGTCGGCQYQHATYETQVRLKLGILLKIFETAGLGAVPEPQVHTGAPWEYRNRIRLRVGMADGALRVGYNRRGSYEMLPIRECPIAASLLMRAAEAMLTVVAKTTELSAWTKQIVEVELFTDRDQSQLQMTFYLKAERRSELTAFCKQMTTIVPELVGAGVIVVGDSGRREQPGARWGADGIKYHAAGREYWVSRGSFFQVNRSLVDELVRIVTAGRGGALAWDLYAGVGLFSRVLIETFAAVTGVETVVDDLRAVLKVSGGRAVGATVAAFLRDAVLQRERPDLIVMDPPRAGLGPDVCELLGRVKAREMVYVSCDPVTLARDLSTVVDSGYTINAVHMVDLFPQTFHMETIVVLNR